MYKHVLEHQLIASAAILELVKDNIFAQQLYAALCNMRWVYLPPDDPESIVDRLTKLMPEDYGPDDACSVSWRQAGGIVADLRNRFLAEQGRFEDYMNWYCSGDEGHVSDRIAKELAAMHWYPVEWADNNVI